MRKLDQILVKLIHLKSNEYTVYDGPGILRDTLKHHNILLCSTFQCVIHILLKYKVLTRDYYFRYYSKSLIASKIIKINQNQVFVEHLPNMNCLYQICMISIDAEYGNQVNVTVTNINHSGFYDTTCMYSGLLTIEILRDGYKESTILCESHDGTKNPSRSFYSHNSSLRLVFYWYRHYSAINLSVSISQTKCNPIEIDGCLYDKYCRKYKSWFPKKCSFYLKYVTQYTWVKMLKQGHNIYSCT